MTVYLAQRPIYNLRCDGPECEEVFEVDGDLGLMSGGGARHAAERAGWHVPPWRGKGSRSRLDYCPKHATSDTP